ncbi:MAG: hypothetical protein FWF05_01060 [Oscillospiraceae bacterium]|nr:hypothetical protein [Oscillospiraceae bacterium]
MKHKQTFTALLLLLAAMFVFASCGTADADAETAPETAAESQIAEAEETSAEPLTDMPETESASEEPQTSEAVGTAVSTTKPTTTKATTTKPTAAKPTTTKAVTSTAKPTTTAATSPGIKPGTTVPPATTTTTTATAAQPSATTTTKPTTVTTTATTTSGGGGTPISPPSKPAPQTIQITLADLKAKGLAERAATITSVNTFGTEKTYAIKGARLTDVLSAYGVDWQKYGSGVSVTLTASDGESVSYNYGKINSAILAWEIDGSASGAPRIFHNTKDSSGIVSTGDFIKHVASVTIS